MNANEMSNDVVNEAIQSENKFFSDYAPTDMSMEPKNAAIEMELLVKVCGSSSVLY
jgi:hypothetical protein